jgi:hypothetical protein
VIFEPGKNVYFSTYPPPTLTHLSHRLTNALKAAAWKSFDRCSSHFRASVSTSSSSAKRLHPVVNRFTRRILSTVNRKHFFMNILRTKSFCPQKNAQQNATLRSYTPQTRSPFWLLKPASEHAHAPLLPRLSWSWTVLLPSDTHRKPITSITAALLHLWPVYWLSLV